MKILPEPVGRKSGRALQSCTDFRNGQALNRDFGEKNGNRCVHFVLLSLGGKPAELVSENLYH